MILLSGCDTGTSGSNGQNNGGNSIRWNDSVTYGAMTDTRDGKTYRTVLVGSMPIMAENLSYAGPNSNLGKCYNDNEQYCAQYGRLYSWFEAMGQDTIFDSTKFKYYSQGICPPGWRLPTGSDWSYIRDTAIARSGLRSAKVEIALKSTSGWADDGNGTDLFGLRIIPSGFCMNGSCTQMGVETAFWDYNYFDTIPYSSGFLARDNGIGIFKSPKTKYSSVRCIQG